MKRMQLEYFVRIVEEKSFTKAAEKLFISQPALSKSIRALEAELGVTLFKRDPRELSLTSEGENVYCYAVDILNYWQSRTAELFSLLEQVKGSLRFGLPPSVGSVFFSKILFEYGCKYPQVDLQIVEGTSKKIEALVMNDQVDLGVVIEPYENPHMRLKTVYRSDVVLAVARNHRLAERTEVEIAELRDEPMLMVSKDYMFHDQVLAHCRQAGFTPNITFTTSQWDLLLEMTAENQGVTLIGRPLVEKLYSGRIKCISLQNPEFLWTLGLISKKCKTLSGAAKDKPKAPALKPEQLKKGDAVRIVSMGLKGTVSSLPDAKGNLFVQCGIMRTSTNIKDLVRIEEATITTPTMSKTNTGKLRMSKSFSVSPEINLLGKTVDEALAALDKYLDDAYLAHLENVRVVHGKGTGALRKAIQQHLKRIKYVKSFRQGEYGEGDAGVTIVEFKK